MKTHVYIVLRCSNIFGPEEVLGVFLTRGYAENQAKKYRQKYPSDYYAVLKKTLLG